MTIGVNAAGVTGVRTPPMFDLGGSTNERSFSSLRRLKTWLRSTMTQSRLNSVAVCHSHQELLDAVDIVKVMREFVSFSDSRSVVFGRL